MIQITTSTNSFQIGGVLCQKGKIMFNVTDDGIIYQNQKYKYDQVECDGTVFSTAPELITWLGTNVFKNGGGSGGGAVNSVTGNLVTGSSEDPIVNLPDWVALLRDDRVGYINASNGTTYNISANSDCVKFLSATPLDTLTIGYPTLTAKIKKVTLIFNCDVNLINHNIITNAFIRNIPTKAKQYDCWTLMYDSGDRTWDFVSVNTMPKWYIDERTPTGTERDVRTWDENGIAISKPLGWRQFSDLPTPPTFSNGVLTGTAFQPNGDALFGFIELALGNGGTALVKPNAIPFYNPGIIGTGGGTLKVANAIESDDAVNKSQLDEATTKTLVYSQLMPNGTPKITTPYMGVLAYITDGDDLQQVNLFALGGNPVTGQPILEDKHIPIYDSNGTLPVGEATDAEHAVNLDLAQRLIIDALNALGSLVIPKLSYTSTGSESNIVTLSTGLTGLTGVKLIVNPTNKVDNYAPAYKFVTDPVYNTNGTITFQVEPLPADRYLEYSVVMFANFVNNG